MSAAVVTLVSLRSEVAFPCGVQPDRAPDSLGKSQLRATLSGHKDNPQHGLHPHLALPAMREITALRHTLFKPALPATGLHEGGYVESPLGITKERNHPCSTC